MRIVADIETNALPHVTVIHCLCAHIIETGESFSFADHSGYLPIADGLDLLMQADFVIGHNFQEFDAKWIKRVRGVTLDLDKVLDTLRLSKLIFDSEALRTFDYPLYEQGRMPLDCVMRHRLEAWGYRLGQPKNSFGKKTDFTFSDELVRYCADDVALNTEFYKMLE